MSKPEATNKYRDTITGLGMNVQRAGRTLGVSPRQTQRFAAGDQMSAPVRKLLRVMQEYKIDPDEVEKF